ncbi:helix-turn-helix domain-containing protein [Oleomonas cavernae]|uniref:helix-turn-helix domain-containing protein n=1 Tax=Oleomonas cavernae TaxID=2320859 RepID=UPI0018F67765|nr:helix-turn-helix transcriptional regulator [Oleomonas cavernae]
MIGHKLKVARAASGMSLRGLAEAMGGLVSAQAIGKYERDEDMPSSRVLIALADTLRVTEDYLLAEDEIALEGVDFRKKAGSSAREEAALEARTIHMLERYLAVEDLLHLRSVDWEQPRSAPHPVADLRDAEDAARSVRDDWGWAMTLFPSSQSFSRSGVSRLCRLISTI